MNIVTPYRVTVACWIILIAAWLLASFSTKPTARKIRAASRVRYLAILLLGVLLVWQSTRFSKPWNLILWEQNEFFGFAGASCAVLGMTFALWARRILGRNWSGAVTLKTDHQLIESGPYALVRHPIYTGMLLMMLGTILFIGTVGCVFGLLLIVGGIWFKLREEETMLLSAFGDQYVDYSARVPRLVPFLL